MLFTDASISSVDDLGGYESEVKEVAAIAGLDLSTKLGLAQTEIGVELLAANTPLAAGYTQRAAFDLGQVVVTDALRLWHIFHALAIVYRDAYNRKLNDKYLLKWNEYRALAKWAANLYFNIGMGLVYRPLPAPGLPSLSSAPGGAMVETIYFIRVTWTDGQGAESAPSPVVSYAVPAGELLSISLVSLEVPPGVTGWFPYVGTAADQEQRQAASPLDPAAAWTMPETGLVAGPLRPQGQAADVFRKVARSLQRG